MKLKTIIVLTCLAVAAIPIGIIAGFEGLSIKIPFIALIALVTISVSLIMAYFISKPIEKITSKIDNISRGKLDVYLPKSEIYEINNLTNSLDRVMASLKLATLKIGVNKGDIFEDAVEENINFHKKHEDLLKTLNGWFWELDKNGVITYCSDTIKDYTGYTDDEIKGKLFFDFIPKNQMETVENFFKNLSKKPEDAKEIRNKIVDKNQDELWIAFKVTPFFYDNKLKGFRGICYDVSNEKENEFRVKELKKDLQIFKAKVNDLLNERDTKRLDKKTESTMKPNLEDKWSEDEFDSVFISDENANILDCNQNMYKRLGYSKSEMLSFNMADFDALESKEELKEKINEAKKNGSTSFKTIHKRKDGSAVLVYENLQYLKDKNQIKCIVREDQTLNKK